MYLVVVYILWYFLYNYKSQLKCKEEGGRGTTETGVGQKDSRRGDTNKQKISVEKRDAHCKLEAGAILEELRNN